MAEQVADFASERFPGSMTIGELESVGFLEPVVRDVAFFTPEGDRVMYVERVRVELSLEDLMAGRVGFSKARVDGGEVVIEIQPNGKTTLEDALKPPEEEGGHKVGLELHNMHFEGMTAIVRLDGEERFVVKHLQGFISVWRRDTPGVRVTLGKVQGEFEKPTLFGNQLALEELKGEVWAQEDHVVSMNLRTSLGSGTIEADLDYHKRPKEVARLKLRSSRGSGANLVTMGTEVRSWFSDKIEVQVE